MEKPLPPLREKPWSDLGKAAEMVEVAAVLRRCRDPTKPLVFPSRAVLPALPQVRNTPDVTEILEPAR